VKTLRSFVLSLAAVFFALALGVVLGARVLPGPMMSGLRGDKGDLQSQMAELRDANAALNQRLSAADQFDAQMSDRIVRGALNGKSVVMFRTPDAESGDVDALAALIEQSGGSITGTVGLTQEFLGANSAEKLRSVVNSPILPPGAALNTALVDPAAQTGDLLGIALLINRDPKIVPVGDEARDTVLAALRDTGFLTFDRVAAADTAVVVTGGGLADDAGNQGPTVARFAAGLAPHGSGLVLAGRDGSADGVSAVALTRADAALAGVVTTVDDVGTAAGRTTTVLALQSMIGGAPAAKYGVGQGAGAVTVPQ